MNKTIQEIEEDINTGKVEAALKKLYQYLDQKKLTEEIEKHLTFVQASRAELAHINSMVQKGILDYENAARTRNRIILSTLKVVHHFKKESLHDSTSEKKDTSLSDSELLQKYSEEKLLVDITDPEEKVLPQSILLDNSELKVPTKNTVIIIDPDRPHYKIPDKFKSKCDQLLAFQTSKKPNLYDSSTIRINKIKRKENEIVLEVSKATYFDYIATNYSMDLQLPGWAKPFRNYVHSGNKLNDLESSPLSNHIGIGVLLFTNDHFLILQKRATKGVNIRQSQVASSISGASEFEDIIRTGSNSLSDIIYREGKEELRIERDDFQQDSITFLGITRELLRGGKPEVFFFAHLKLNYEEVTLKSKYAKDRNENERIEGVEFESLEFLDQKQDKVFQDALKNDINRVKLIYKDDISLPLLTNIIFLYKYWT